MEPGKLFPRQTSMIEGKCLKKADYLSVVIRFFEVLSFREDNV